MNRCPACSAVTPAESNYCSTCGQPLEGRSATPTVTSFDTGAGAPSTGQGAGEKRPPTLAGRLASGEAMETARFLPGVVLAGRYRVIGLIGRGGMGEIYRADDLKLGQPVALKFLPEELAQDPAWLARFHAEVRIARQVSHPNVCRVHDIGEVGPSTGSGPGQHYFTMEYVDGEDLASLLRRIGRLPRDKAVDIARQLCAGLAAAHDRGVLHRDLKPANVMIDGRGRVRLTDFGIAGLAGAQDGRSRRSGTPAYMAPELLAGGDATVRSDLYALGLVLYETFTGKPAFEADTLADLKRLQQSTAPESPSRVQVDVEPAVERVILRCLAKDPAERPASALAVAAALPGGDPLAAALAAGETPSPDMVAAAGSEGTLRPVVAWSALAGLVACVALLAFSSGRMSLLRKVPFDTPTDVLVDRAQQTLLKAGVTGPAGDRAWGFRQPEHVLSWLEKQDESPARWDRLSTGRLGAVGFWYRQSPKPLESLAPSGQVSLELPPFDVPGMAGVLLDERGRLVELRVNPVRGEGAAQAAARPDWNSLFGAAGLDFEAFTPDPPEWLPLSYADDRAAWKGTCKEFPGVPVRVEAASYLGRPVYFKTVWPWTPQDAAGSPSGESSQRASQAVAVLLILVGLGFALLLARRNLRSGRGDLRGATRMALSVVALFLLQWLLVANHLPSLADEFSSWVRGTGLALFVGAFVWLLYLALEPAVRKLWPHTLVSWSRLLAGKVGDPLVGRDLLVGGAIGAALTLLGPLEMIAIGWLGLPPSRPIQADVDALRSIRQFLGALLRLPTSAILGPMLMLFLILGLRYLLKKQWLAVTAAALMFLATVLLGENPVMDAPFAAVAIGVQLFLLLRLGLNTLIVAAMVAGLLSTVPLTVDPSAWYAGYSMMAMAIPIAAGVYGLVLTTRRGRGACNDSLLD